MSYALLDDLIVILEKISEVNKKVNDFELDSETINSVLNQKYDDVEITGNAMKFYCDGVLKKTVTIPSTTSSGSGATTEQAEQIETNKSNIAQNTADISTNATNIENLDNSKYDDVSVSSTNLIFSANGTQQKTITLPKTGATTTEVNQINTNKTDITSLKSSKYDDVVLSGSNLQFKANGTTKKTITLPSSSGTTGATDEQAAQIETNKTDIASLKVNKYDDVSVSSTNLIFSANGTQQKTITLPKTGATTTEVNQINTNKTDITSLKSSKYDDVVLSGSNLQFKANGTTKKTITLPTGATTAQASQIETNKTNIATNVTNISSLTSTKFDSVTLSNNTLNFKANGVTKSSIDLPTPSSITGELTLTSPNGSVYKIIVDNNGNLSTQLVSGTGGDAVTAVVGSAKVGSAKVG